MKIIISNLWEGPHGKKAQVAFDREKIEVFQARISLPGPTTRLNTGCAQLPFNHLDLIRERIMKHFTRGDINNRVST